MRVLLALCVLLCGCEYNYYGAVADGGVTDMPGYTDNFGEYHETEPNQGIFKYDSKLQGRAQLTLAPAPALVAIPGFPLPRLPFVREDLATMAMGQTLIDLATRDDKPHVVTLSFGKVVPTPIVAVGPYAEVVAILNMGIGGAAYYAEVDVVEGVQFSLAVNRLQVIVVYRIPYGGGAMPATPPVVDVGVSASSDVIAHGRQPQRTILFGGTALNPAIAAGPGTAGVPFIIPSFSKSFKPVAIPTTSTYDLALASANGGNIVGGYNIVAPAAQDYPVPSGAYYAVAYNTGAAAIVYYGVVFELAL